MMKSWLLLSVIAGSLAGCSKPAPAPAPPVATAPAPGSAPAPVPVAPTAGRVVTEHFHSEALGVDKDVVVYLPAGYDAQPARRWPVFYYLHGLGGNETNWVKHGHLDQVADQAGLAAIVVMPDGDDDFYVNSGPMDYDRCLKDGAGLFPPTQQKRETACVHSRNYETYIARDLVAWVDGTYHTIASRDGRAIAGLSMGGFGAMAIALDHQDEFAAAASHSGAIALLYRGPHPYVAGKAELLTNVARTDPAAGPIVAWIQSLLGKDLANWKAFDVVEQATKMPAGKVWLYFDCGTEDDFKLNDNLLYVHEALTAKHVEHEYFEGPGKHDFAFWTARLPHSLAFLTAHTAKPQ